MCRPFYYACQDHVNFFFFLILSEIIKKNFLWSLSNKDINIKVSPVRPFHLTITNKSLKYFLLFYSTGKLRGCKSGRSISWSFISRISRAYTTSIDSTSTWCVSMYISWRLNKIRRGILIASSYCYRWG